MIMLVVMSKIQVCPFVVFVGSIQVALLSHADVFFIWFREEPFSDCLRQALVVIHLVFHDGHVIVGLICVALVDVPALIILFDLVLGSFINVAVFFLFNIWLDMMRLDRSCFKSLLVHELRYRASRYSCNILTFLP